MTTLHYAGHSFDVGEESDVNDLADRISGKLTGTGGWVEVQTDEGPIAILIAAGIPVWLDYRELPVPRML